MATLTVITNAAYAYSAAGCVTDMDYTDSASATWKTVDLSWNSLYQLMQVETNGGFAECYQYDALGRRISVSNEAGLVYFVYDGIHVVAELDGDCSLTKRYTWGPGIDNLLAVTTGYSTETTNTYWAIKDHLGTVHALTDSSGVVVESYRYDAWGRVLGVYDADGAQISESAVGNRYLWQGREYSWSTGLYHFRARSYDPVTGRWLSNDPIGVSGGLNQYTFCGNNPINGRDPSGLAPGDVYLYYDNNNVQTAIGAATVGGSFGHAGVEVAGGYILTSRDGGVTLDSPSSLAGQNVVTYRPLGDVNEQALAAFAGVAISENTQGYDWSAFFGKQSNSGEEYTCASVVAEALRRAGIRIPEDRLTTPNNLANDPYLIPLGKYLELQRLGREKQPKCP